MSRIFLVALGLLGLLASCGDDDTASGDTATTVPGSDAAGGISPTGEDGGFPIAELTITVEHPDTGSATYQLTCLADTATLSGDAVDVVDQDACAALVDPEVVTRLVSGPPPDQICTEIYGGPDVATITGTIDEQAVDTTVDRANGCGINDWDVLLAALLPPAIGVTG